jgi:hypothetical protein
MIDRRLPPERSRGEPARGGRGPAPSGGKGGSAVIKFIRSVQFKGGAQQEVVQWAKDIADYVNRAVRPAGPFQVFVEVFGATGTVHWIADFQDLATLERSINQLGEDHEYLALVRADIEKVVPGSLRDKVLRSV